MRLIVFIFGTAVLLYFSWWYSIKDRRYHGIYRFFSLESIMVLVLHNAKAWFRDPFSFHQTVSWICLTSSLLLAVHGFYLLRKIGKPKGRIENTTKLVAQGAYRYIRHPLYGSLVLGGLGAFFKNVDLWACVLAAVNILSLFLTAKVEEKEMLSKFGDEYRSYMKKTRMFLPFII